MRGFKGFSVCTPTSGHMTSARTHTHTHICTQTVLNFHMNGDKRTGFVRDSPYGTIHSGNFGLMGKLSANELSSPGAMISVRARQGGLFEPIKSLSQLNSGLLGWHVEYERLMENNRKIKSDLGGFTLIPFSLFRGCQQTRVDTVLTFMKPFTELTCVDSNMTGFGQNFLPKFQESTPRINKSPSYFSKPFPPPPNQLTLDAWWSVGSRHAEKHSLCIWMYS